MWCSFVDTYAWILHFKPILSGIVDCEGQPAKTFCLCLISSMAGKGVTTAGKKQGDLSYVIG